LTPEIERQDKILLRIHADKRAALQRASSHADSYNADGGQRDTWLPWSRNDHVTGTDLLESNDLSHWASFNRNDGNEAAAQALASAADIQLTYRKLDAEETQVNHRIGALTIEQIRMSLSDAMSRQ